MSSPVLDVLIVGAGVSGIGVACHLKRRFPNKTFAILERRAAIGGTWDLFRYPGIRSDSDMFTFGYEFRPWTEPKTLADGPSIQRYVTETARAHDVDRHIRFGRKVVRAAWSGAERLWIVDVISEADGRREQYRARFLVGCTGYYNYDAGYDPKFPGEETFEGTIVHPQRWPDGLDYGGKRVVVIGSGATAVTLVPSMADRAAHVTMLQRSPTYILSLPSMDPVTSALRRLPSKVAYQAIRARNIAISRAIFVLARRSPKAARKLLLGLVKKQLGGAVDMRHFTPAYDPWTQRLCIVPDGDLFKVLREGKASVVTDHIESFTKTGLRLRSGATLDADLVVKATGLDIQMFGGVEVTVDGAPVNVAERMTYKGVLVQDVPNAAMVFGYTNISWTLKVDLACNYLCRLLEHMDAHGFTRVVPRDREGVAADGTVFGGLDSGYVRRAADRLPRQGARAPWRVLHDYPRDTWMLRYEGIEDPALELTR